MNAAQPESRFQDPTEWCPHPERWHATDGDSTEQEVTELIAAFARALQPDLVIETGSGFGQTTALLAESLWLNGQGRLVSFETNADRLEQVQDRVAHIPARFWELRNEDVREWVPLGVIDLAFLDTTREVRVDDFLYLRSWFRRGSVVLFHDSLPYGVPLRGWIENEIIRPGYAAAVDLPTPRGLTICGVL